LVALLVAAGCTGGRDSARGVADAFVDAHYVRIDLEASKVLCEGVARDKVEHEIELTSNTEIEADTMRPKIYYKIHDERVTDERSHFVYELSIRPPGLDPFTKYSAITVRRTDDGWKVTNYVETDAGP
jgi:hypothetical protein